MKTISSEKLLKLYRTVVVPNMIKYPPIRKHYNMHLFG